MAPGDSPEKEGEIDFAHAIERAPGPERVSSLTRAILDTAPDGIVAIDVEGRVVEFNPAATRIFGWERDEVLGESLSELIVPPELREAHKRGFERFLKTGHGPVIGKRLELDALRNGGERFPIEMTITVVDEGPEPVFVAHLRDISERYAAERAAAESEWRLREMTEQLELGTWVNDWQEGRVLHANRAAMMLTGQSAEQLDAGSMAWVDRLHPDDRSEIVAFLNGPAPTGRREFEVRMRTEEDDYRWLHVRVFGVDREGQQRVVGLAEDVTERKRTEQDLRRFRFMVERLSDAVYWIDRDARILYCNRAAADGLGMEVDELIGREVFDFDEDLPRDAWAQHWADLELRGHFVLDSHHRRRDGSVFPVEVSVNHVSFSGTPFNCAIVRDVTEQREAQEELEDALDEARRSKQARDAFIANLSHEIRSPLTAMLGFCKLLGDKVRDDAESRLWLDLVQRNGQHLERMLSDMLRLRDVEAGVDAIEMERTTLSELLATDLAGYRQRAVQAGLAFRIETDDDLPRTFETDPTRVRQLLDNLVDNALKYTDSGTITLEVRLLDRHHDRACVRFGVRDTGCGIAPSRLASAFDRFRRFNDDPDVRGVGLGLPIVRHLAQALGGDAQLESEVGVGTFAYVDLPLHSCEGSGALLAATSSDARDGGYHGMQRLRGRILLAEDARDLSMLYSRWLTDWGLEVTAVPDGRQALIAAASGDFDLMLLDWRMPSLDGLQVVDHVRRSGIDAPILGISAHATSEAQIDWLAAGANAYLTKPVDPRELHRALAELLRLGTPPAVPEPAAPPSMDSLRQTFLDGLRTEAERLRAALEAGDELAAKRVAHRFKGSAPSFGYDELGRLSAELEQACDAGGEVLSLASARWFELQSRLITESA